MSPKNAIKMINIQKFYLVHFGLILSILSTLVLCSQFDPNWSYFVHFNPIQASSSYLVHFVLFGPNLSFVLIRSTWVPFNPIQSTLVHFVLFSPTWSNSVHHDPIRSTSIICSNSVHLHSIRSIRSTLVLFG